MNVLFTAILVNLIIPGDSGDFDEPADSRKSDNVGKSVKPVDSGESDNCGEYAYFEESFDYAESVDSIDFVESSYPDIYGDSGKSWYFGEFTNFVNLVNSGFC